MPGPARSRVLGGLIAAGLAVYGATRRRTRARRQQPKRAAPRPHRRWELLSHVWNELDRNHVSVLAAGVAFYALLAIFPGMSALISTYGLVADPIEVASELSALRGILPTEAMKLLSDQLNGLVHAPPAKLGIGLVVSLLLALWSATSGTSVLMQALTVAYDEHDGRSVGRFYLVACGLTIGLAMFALVSLFLVAGVPAVLDLLPLPDFWKETLSFIRWPILAGLVVIGLDILYRFAPDRTEARWQWVSWGAVTATLLWLVGSAGFSFYVARFGSYDKTYGSLGAVVILLMWFYVSAYIVLAGAELNAEIDKGARRAAAAPAPLLDAAMTAE